LPQLRYVPRGSTLSTKGDTQEAVMADGDASGEKLRDRITRQGEDALGKLAQDLLENPLVTGALTRAFDAREKAVAAQETAMSALNLPSAADLERLTRRLRSVSQRLEGIEDGVDRLDRRFEEVSRTARPPDDRLAAIEAQLSKLASEVAQLARGLDSAPAHVPREQERLEVDKPAAKAPARKRARRAKKS
jgi:chromosome segregation ATPase